MSEAKAVCRLPECDVHLQGHWVYVRQCTKPETYSGTSLYRCEKDKRVSHVCEVLAVGKAVGTRRNRPKYWCRARKIPRTIAPAMEVGDFVLVPENSPYHLLKVSPFDKHEFFVDESVILGVLKDD